MWNHDEEFLKTASTKRKPSAKTEGFGYQAADIRRVVVRLFFWVESSWM